MYNFKHVKFEELLSLKNCCFWTIQTVWVDSITDKQWLEVYFEKAIAMLMKVH